MIRIFMPLLLSIFLFGCEQNPYQTIEGKDGEAVSLETPEFSGLKNRLEKSLRKSLDWGEFEMPNRNLKAKLVTSWEEGRLYYKFKAYPYDSLEKALNKVKESGSYLPGREFIVKLIDGGGFSIKEISIGLMSMTKVVDAEGEPVELVVNSNIECNKEEYAAIAGYNFAWTLDEWLIPIYDDKYGSVLDEFILYRNPDNSLSKRAKVDIYKVFNSFNKTVRYDEALEQNKKAAERNLNKQKIEIEKMQQQRKDITKNLRAYRHIEKGAFRRIKNDRDTKMIEILEDIDRIIVKYGEKNKYKAIYNSNMPNCSEEDLTDKIIGFLNSPAK